MKTIEKKPLYTSSVKERNIDKYGMQDLQCECCGKLMKDNESLFVHMGTDWNAYNVFESEIINGVEYIKGTTQQSQGCFRIGNDCAKKMKGFTFTM